MTTKKVPAFAAQSATSGLAPFNIMRREPGPQDVEIEILYCGICHSDLHSVRNEWSEFMATNYPIVPGHEIVGRVTKVGSAVTKYKPGDLAAVGCMVDSDGTCANCKAGLEQFCPNMILTFNSPDKHACRFQFILDAVSADHDINAYINLLGVNGNLTLVGAPAKPLGVAAFSLIGRRRSLSGSMIGGIAETQEMLDFCGAHNITADVEVIPIQKVNEAYERLLKSDVKYRFSIDMASLKSE